MPQERLPKQALPAKANGRRPVDDQELDGPIYCIDDLVWNRMVLHPSEMINVTEDRAVWRLNLELCSLKPPEKAGNKERRSLLVLWINLNLESGEWFSMYC